MRRVHGLHKCPQTWFLDRFLVLVESRRIATWFLDRKSRGSRRVQITCSRCVGASGGGVCVSCWPLVPLRSTALVHFGPREPQNTI